MDPQAIFVLTVLFTSSTGVRLGRDSTLEKFSNLTEISPMELAAYIMESNYPLQRFANLTDLEPIELATHIMGSLADLNIAGITKKVVDLVNAKTGVELEPARIQELKDQIQGMVQSLDIAGITKQVVEVVKEKTGQVMTMEKIEALSLQIEEFLTAISAHLQKKLQTTLSEANRISSAVTAAYVDETPVSVDNSVDNSVDATVHIIDSGPNKNSESMTSFITHQKIDMAIEDSDQCEVVKSVTGSLMEDEFTYAPGYGRTIKRSQCLITWELLDEMRASPMYWSLFEQQPEEFFRTLEAMRQPFEAQLGLLIDPLMINKVILERSIKPEEIANAKPQRISGSEVLELLRLSSYLRRAFLYSPDLLQYITQHFSHRFLRNVTSVADLQKPIRCKYDDNLAAPMDPTPWYLKLRDVLRQDFVQAYGYNSLYTENLIGCIAKCSAIDDDAGCQVENPSDGEEFVDESAAQRSLFLGFLKENGDIASMIANKTNLVNALLEEGVKAEIRKTLIEHGKMTNVHESILVRISRFPAILKMILVDPNIYKLHWQFISTLYVNGSSS